LLRIYIAHPLVGDGSQEWGNMERNVERYLRFVAMAMDQGHVVLTWVHHYMTHVRRLTAGNADYYLDRDCSLIYMANEFWIAGPLAVSHGMQVEHQIAMKQGIVIRQEPGWDDPDFWPESKEIMAQSKRAHGQD
jgi:hypothetical protein